MAAHVITVKCTDTVEVNALFVPAYILCELRCVRGNEFPWRPICQCAVADEPANEGR